MLDVIEILPLKCTHELLGKWESFFFTVEWTENISIRHECWQLELCAPLSVSQVWCWQVESLPLGGNSSSLSVNSASCTKCWLRHSWNGFSLCTVYPCECHRHLDNYPKPASMQMAPRSNSLPLTFELFCFHISISLLDTLTYLIYCHPKLDTSTIIIFLSKSV